MFFSDYVFNKLSSYIIANDNPKYLGIGLLQRFLRVLEDEWNTNLLPLIDNFTDILNPFTTTQNLLSNISYSIGSPINPLEGVSGFEDFYRNYLSYFLSINKIKGTVKSYEILFAILGYSVSITIEPPPDNTWDADPTLRYDDEGVRYDEGCPPCGKYKLTLSSLGGTPRVILDSDTQDLFNNIIGYLQPADMQLDNSNGIQQMYIDLNGDLIYDGFNPLTIFSLVDGDLIVTGFEEDRYSLVDGDLIYT